MCDCSSDVCSSELAGDGELELVRCTEAPGALLEPDRHRHRVLHAVAAPGLADAGLHGAQRLAVGVARLHAGVDHPLPDGGELLEPGAEQVDALPAGDLARSEEHTSELQSLMRISYAVFCLKKKKEHTNTTTEKTK